MASNNPLIRKTIEMETDHSNSRTRLHNVDEETNIIYSSNIRTLRTTNTKQDANDFMRRYFSNLVGMKEGLKSIYFEKSYLTFNGEESYGLDFILMSLSKLIGCPFYNIQFISSQPSLGNGIFIIVNGNSPGHIFHMTLNLVSIKKKYRILNQFIQMTQQNMVGGGLAPQQNMAGGGGLAPQQNMLGGGFSN
tara:strand:- start:1857 stop:2432 length:576 start_codon:yes stop_codon:yes gene_type:complete